MAGLWSTLNVASTGLNAQQAGVSTAGANVANASTAGYTRRRLELETLSGGANTVGGVRSKGTSRVDEPFLKQTASRAGVDLAGAQTRSDWLSRIEAVRAPLEGSRVANAIEDFSDAFSALAARPEDTATRQTTLAAARNVANAFNQANDDLSTLRSQMDAATASVAQRASSLASELASLNARISTDPNAADSALLDKRDAIAAELAAVTGGSVMRNSEGHLNVQALGTMLVDGIHAQSLKTQPGAASGSLELVVTNLGGATAVVTSRATQGEIGALFDVRNGALAQQQTALDALAFTFGSTVNTQHAAGFGIDGVSGRPLFDIGASATGAANAIGLAAGMTGTALAASASAVTLPGDNRNALLIADMRGTAATNFAEQERTSIAGLTSASGSALSDLEGAAGRNDVAKSMLTQSTGVSLDEEFVALQQYQRAYQANARVLQTVDSLLETLVNL